MFRIIVTCKLIKCDRWEAIPPELRKKKAKENYQQAIMLCKKNQLIDSDVYRISKGHLQEINSYLQLNN
ncbi:hypothetical protein [uncultured Nostoc sp.]|uniref:hypothetical protein n=1 Tax=uncultured Nostoc sp. TaxID=340711 RepID=UPI0026238157|nr:hypothetical protein [uncultured Nostoc sp.]